MDIDKLEYLINKDYTIQQIANELRKSPTSIRYWMKKFGLKTNHEQIGKRTSKIWSIPDDNFRRLVQESPSMADALRKLGLTKRSENYQPLRKRCLELGVSPNKAKNGQFRKISILRKDSTANRSSIKSKILREGLLEYICQICGIPPIWNGKELSLTLDHINGESTDHRIENLRFICPNCDRQLPTYCNKNWKVN
jgi:5-methylcytosine-specific restriction endonuclease McrA